MKLSKISLLVILFSFVLVGCVRSTDRKSESKVIENLPEVIRDTIIVRDTVAVVKEEVKAVEEEVKQEVKEEKPAQKVTSTTASTKRTARDERNDYDAANSGFFDNYKENFKGDPNEGISDEPIRKVISSSNADELERKKEAILKSLDALEQKNEQEKARFEELEKEREAYNQKAIEEAKAKQAELDKKKKAKTLDTDLLLKKK